MAAQQYDRYKERRNKLVASIPQLKPSDLILVCGAVEPHSARFVQDKNFQYFTGLEEPSALLCIDGRGDEILFVPNYDGIRAQWVASELVPSETVAQELGIAQVRYQGAPEKMYSFVPFRRDAQYSVFLEHVKQHLGSDGVLHVIGQPGWQVDNYGQQMAWFLGKFLPELHEQKRIVDISPEVAHLRRTKDEYEIECIRKAIAITTEAQAAAREAITAGASESDAVAAIQATFTRHGSFTPAFPSIVATGKNATVLHYLSATAQFQEGEAVVVDIGASFDGYAADITRTYPVGKTFSARQREIYSLVLDAQAHIASIARPGMYLMNNDKPEQSLNHITREFFKKHGLENYMPHGIGHFMGLDVHDVGDRSIPLMPGDVITIEPGLYLPEEGIGVRIEDDYLITDEGAQCLSPDIPKELAQVQG